MPFDLAESFVLAAEKALGATLPVSYRNSVLRENGGEFEAKEDEWQQYPITDTTDRKRLSRTANHIIKETESCRGWPNFPEHALAIAGNGGGDQLILLKNGALFEPTVYLWLHDTGQLIKIADDFSELKAP